MALLPRAASGKGETSSRWCREPPAVMDAPKATRGALWPGQHEGPHLGEGSEGMTFGQRAVKGVPGRRPGLGAGAEEGRPDPVREGRLVPWGEARGGRGL